MKCREVIRKYSSALDGNVPAREIRTLQRHIRGCPECALRAHQLNALKGTLRAMPQRKPPAELSTRLRVAASHEASLKQRRAAASSPIAYWLDVIQIWSSNLMRPFALPAAGGLVTAIFLFSMIAPTFTVRAASSIAQDVPTGLSTQAALARSVVTYGTADEDVIVDVWVDGTGRMVTYSVPAGQDWHNDPGDPALHRELAALHRVHPRRRSSANRRPERSGSR